MKYLSNCQAPSTMPCRISTKKSKHRVLARSRSAASLPDHSLALKNDGRLLAWGANASHQIGDGTTNEHALAYQVGVASDWIAVAAGPAHSLALKTDGSLWGWGAHNFISPASPNGFSPVPTYLMNLFWVSTNSSISGRVLDAKSGLPLLGATVLVGFDSTTTAADGSYSINPIDADQYTALVKKDGYSPLVQEIEIPLDTTLAKDFQLSIPANDISVDSIDNPFGNNIHFLDKVSLMVAFTANVNWGVHPPGFVQFITPKKTVPVNAGSPGTSVNATFDVGGDFGPNGRLKARAVSTDGTSSGETLADFIVMSSPLPSSQTFVWAGGAARVLYTNAAPFSLSLLLSQAGLSGGQIHQDNGQGDIPFFSGKPANLSFEPLANCTVNGDGGAQVDKVAGISAAVSFAGVNGSFAETISGQRRFGGKAWQAWQGFSVGYKGAVESDNTWPILPVPGVGGLYFKSEIGLHGDATVLVLGLDPTVQLANPVFDLGAHVGGEIAAELGIVGVRGYLTAGGDVQFTTPPPHVTQATIGVTVGAEAHLLVFQWSNQAHWAWSLSGNTPNVLALIPKDREALHWEIMPRDYLQKQGAGLFVGGRRASASAAHRFQGTAKIAQAPIQTQVFPLTQPSLNSAGTNTFLVWLSDNAARASLDRTMAVFSTYDGNAWSAPVPLQDDGTADFHPNVRVFPDSSAWAAWENEARTFGTNGDAGAMLTNLEISVAAYDPIRSQWGTALRLTHNQMVDFQPKLAGPSSTNVLLTWLADPFNQGAVTGAGTNQLWYAVWNGAAWSPPQLAATITHLVLGYDVAYDGQTAHVAMSVNAEDDPASSNGLDLFGLTWQGGVWSGLQQLTSDQVPDQNPQLGIDNRGDFVLAWLKNDELSSVVNFDFSQRQIIQKDQNALNLAGFRVAASVDGRLGIVWAQPSTNNSDLFAQFFDPTYLLWGHPKQLTFDPEVESGLTVAFAGTNSLLAVYTRSDPVPAGGTQNPAASITPTPGSSDLWVLKYQVGGDLAINPGGLACNPPNPSPLGQATLTATVSNQGDTVANGFTAAFYAGDPAAGGVLIGQTNSGVLLLPGDQIQVSVPWAVPFTNSSVIVFCQVQGVAGFVDLQPGNNTATLQLLLADLALDSITWRSAGASNLTLTARVGNQGSISSGPFTVQFLLNATNGPILASATVNGLPPGKSQDVSVVIDATAMPMDFSVFAVISEAGTAGDFNPGNNSSDVFLDRSTMQPAPVDLGISQTTDKNPGAMGYNLTYILTVTNHGSSTASGVNIAWTSPGGSVFVSADNAFGSVTPSFGSTTFNLGSLTNGGVATVYLTVRPTISGTLSSSATVSSYEPDLAPTDNSSTNSTTINATHQPPTATLTSPANNVTNPAPATLALGATGVAAEGTVAKLEILEGNRVVGSSGASPFAMVASNVLTGRYLLTARVTDSFGAVGLSAPVVLTVLPGTPEPIYYQITDLGVAPGGFSSAARDINQTGAIAGVSATASANVPFIWQTGTGMTALSFNGASDADANAISSGGDVAGFATLTNINLGFLYHKGQETYLPAFPGGRGSQAAGLNDLGWITGQSQLSNGFSHAYLYAGTNLVDLGTLTGLASSGILQTGIYSAGHSVNTAGQVAGEAENGLSDDSGNSTSHAFRWDATAGMVDLGTLGGYSSAAYRINDHGQTAGQSDTTNAQHAFLISAGFMADLGTLGGNRSVARGLNNLGAVAGEATDSNSVLRAFIYRAGVLQDLNQLLPPGSTWQLQSAGAINDSGQIAATGFRGFNQAHAVLLTPASGVPTNPPPSVVVTSPTNGAVLGNAFQVQISAEAEDSNGSVSNVQFYADGVLIGSASFGPPYSFTWSGPSQGRHILTAVATDNAGAQSVSAPVVVTLGNPPGVTLTRPAPGVVFTAPATVYLEANAASPHGQVTNVSFYVNGTAIGSASAPPFNLYWTNVAPGSYQITAVGTDNSGLAGGSVAVQITVITNSPVGGGYSLTDLGSLGIGGTVAASLNNVPQVVGSVASGLNQRAFLWMTSGGLMALKLPPGATDGFATAVNDAGQVAGYSYGPTNTAGFVWTAPGGIVDLGNLGGPLTQPQAINSAGVVVGVSEAGTPYFFQRGFQWTQTGGIQLIGGANLTDPALRAYGINASGQIAGYENTYPAYKAFVRSPAGQIQLLGALPSNDSSEAYAINDSGQIVGESYGGTAPALPFIWSPSSGITNLPLVPSAIAGRANAINRDGVIVGGLTFSNNVARAFVYARGRMTNLNDLLPPGSPWEFNSAAGVNDAGQIIVNGRLGGQQASCLLTPAAPSARPVLSVTRAPAGSVTIGWTGSGILQSATALAGAQTVWTSAGTNSPVTVKITRPTMFFRVAQ